MARANDSTIRDLDSQYHAAVFQRDAAIQRCFDAHRLRALRKYRC